MTERRYRCGWCGQPVDEQGYPLSDEFLSSTWMAEWSEARQVQGQCCRKQVEEEERRAAYEMAMDADDLDCDGEVY